ncbi:MAG: RNA-binding S4 domain-containing protein [Sneathiella sp.]|nr:RNA-binding S4 domain-containing protein [Sneathiella sp.]
MSDLVGKHNGGTTIRVDRWLWFSRFFKSRSLAAKLVQGKKVRINSVLIAKPSVNIRSGDVLTFPQANAIRVVKVLDIGSRRGPAVEAQMLYEDLSPPEAPKTEEEKLQAAAPRRDKGAGRPTKVQRRAIDNLKNNFGDEI